MGLQWGDVTGSHLLRSHNLPRGDVCVGMITEVGERGGGSELKWKKIMRYTIHLNYSI